jgi:pyruvate/2-oxoglutarate dehydrogenase complex dihydrolipoamide dehydrogenase (E3) component
MKNRTDPRNTFDLIVIGAGPAGVSAALRAGTLGARVALVDRQRMGGTCTNTGCVPTRVMAITARLMRDIRGASAYGIQIDTPTLDWPQTMGKVRQVIADIQNMKRVQDKLRDLGGELFLEGAASFLDSHTVRLADSGLELNAANFILAVGGKARRPPFPGAELAITPDEVIDLEVLPRSVAIVGSGYTGVQLTTVMNAFGVAVTLLETAPNILPPADPDVAGALRESFELQGIHIVTGLSNLERITQEPSQIKHLSYIKSGEVRTVQAETVILAVGWPADLEGLCLAKAGVELERGYVKMNELLQTTASHIYVAGDANGRDMLVQGAVFEAEVAADNAVLNQTTEYYQASLPNGGFTDPDHAGVGLTEPQARNSGRPYLVAIARYTDLERAIIDSRKVGFFKLIAEPSTGRILGGHAAGENAVEIIQTVATAMATGSTVVTLAKVRFAYPTYTAIIGEAARKLCLALKTT